MLESTQHTHSAFVTLTYSDQDLPLLSSGLATLRPKDAQDWLKRLRKEISPLKLRYFLVGEYGDDTHRPHYHAILYGYPPCSRGQTKRDFTRDGPDPALTCCDPCRTLAATWKRGRVFSGTVERSSAQYVCGYVTKKLTKDDGTLHGRHPEFARMSNRPGLGFHFLHDVGSTILQYGLDLSQADVPVSLRHGSKEWPLGRYLTRNLRKLVGKDESCPPERLIEIQNELQAVRTYAFNNSLSFAECLAEASKGTTASMTARAKIHKQRKSL